MATRKELLDVATDAASYLEWELRDDEIGGIARLGSNNENAALTGNAAKAFGDAGYPAKELRHSKENDGRTWVVVFDRDIVEVLLGELANPELEGVDPSDFPPIAGGLRTRDASWQKSDKDTDMAIAFLNSVETRTAVVDELVKAGMTRKKGGRDSEGDIDIFNPKGSFAVVVPLAKLQTAFPGIRIRGVETAKAPHPESFAEREETRRDVEKDPFEAIKSFTWRTKPGNLNAASIVIGGREEAVLGKKRDAVVAELSEIEGLEVSVDDVKPREESLPRRPRITVEPISALQNATDIDLDTPMRLGKSQGKKQTGGRRRR